MKRISHAYPSCRKCNGNGTTTDSWGNRVGQHGGRAAYIMRCSQCEYYRKQDNEKSARRAAHKDANAHLRLAWAAEEANRLKALELELLAKQLKSRKK